MYYVIFFDALLIYALLYEKGFKVVALVDKAKATLILHARTDASGTDWKVLKRQLRSVPSIGIKVGEFHTLERTSTPVFLHYVLTNIVNMLVVYG